MEENKINKLSASSISTFLSCPLKFKFRYVDKLEGPSDSPHLLYGTAVHAAIDSLHKSIWNEDKITKTEMARVFVSSWEMGIELNEIPVKWYRPGTQKDMAESGLSAVQNYYEVHKNDPPPLTLYDKGKRFPAVEMRFLIPLDSLIKTKGWHLSGVIDLVQQIGEETYVVDHKTSSENYNEFKVKTDLQLAIYSYAFRELAKMDKFIVDKEDYVMFDVISKKKPVIYYHKRKIGQGAYNHLAYIIETMIGQIERKEFLPNYGPTCYAYNQSCEFMEHCGNFKYSMEQG